MSDLEALSLLIKKRISAEQLQPGDHLGNERSLAEEFQVSRNQLRGALEMLERDGKIRRRIGRGGGIVVTDGRIERNLNTIESLPDITRQQGIKLETQMLQGSIVLPSAHEQRVLNLQADEGMYLIERLRIAADAPLSIETSRLPCRLFPGLLQHDLTSLYGCLKENYNVQPRFSDETLEIIPCPTPFTRPLNLSDNDQVIRVSRISYNNAGAAIELGQEIFIPHRMRFHLRQYGYVRPSKADG